MRKPCQVATTCFYNILLNSAGSAQLLHPQSSVKAANIAARILLNTLYSVGMKVTGYGTIKPTTTLRRRDGTNSAGSFSELLSAAQTEASSSAAEASEVSHAAPLGSLLALQEVSEEERKRERMIKRGKIMLDALEKLRQQLLIGEIPAHMLPELAATVAGQKEGVSDPHLMMLIDEIELRLAVELAKLEMSFASRSAF